MKPIKKRSSPALSTLDLICVAGEALRLPAPPPAFLIVPTGVHYPYYYLCLYHSDHPTPLRVLPQLPQLLFSLR